MHGDRHGVATANKRLGRLGWFAIVGALPLLAWAERQLPKLASESVAHRARWITAAPGDGLDFTLFAVRDFELAGRPGRAQVHCQAREDYFLYLNGSLLGVGRRRDSAVVDTYEVGYLLTPGVNRLLVELRHDRGPGALLLQLNVDGREPLSVGSDESWRISRSYSDELLAPGGVVRDAQPAVELERPPTGRWGAPTSHGARPEFAQIVDLSAELFAPRATSERTGGAWRGLGVPTVSSPPLGRTVTFDFGREVTGFPNVVFGRKEGAVALVFAGRELPDPEVDLPTAYLVNPVGRKSWSGERPLRLRYLTVLASAEMVGARVLPLLPEFSRSVLADRGVPGAFGLRPLRLRAPVEDEIRSELERLAGLADG